MTDPFVGKLCFFPCLFGKIESGSSAYNLASVKENVSGRILQMHANRKKDIDAVYSGDIAAVVGVKEHHHR